MVASIYAALRLDGCHRRPEPPASRRLRPVEGGRVANSHRGDLGIRMRGAGRNVPRHRDPSS
jgi:hypothetical protein